MNHHLEQVAENRQNSGNFWNRFILVLQYFLVGNIFGINYSMPYTYKVMPSYNFIAFFSLIGLIPNFKFLLSPFLENHTSLSYGKRKTWMVISSCCISLLLFTSSFYSGDHQQIQIGIIFLIQKIFLGINHTCIDSLALKQYKQKSKISFLQSTIHRIGGQFGGFIFLLMISPHFGSLFGKSLTLMTTRQYFILNAAFYLFVTILSHFSYKQQQLEVETVIMHQNYWDLIKSYKVFFQIDNTYCRLIIFFFLYHLGLACFLSGFRIIIVKQYGYSKQNYMTITALMMFPILPFAYLFSRNIGRGKIDIKIQLVLAGRWIIDVISFLYKVDTTLPLCVYYFFADGFRQFQGILIHTLMNDISNVGLAPMFLSASTSLRKAVMNHAWSLKLIDIFGFQLCCAVGFIQQIIIILYIPKLISWIFDGQQPQEVHQKYQIEES